MFVLQHLASVHDHVSVEVQEFVEADWEEYIRRKAKELGGDAYGHRLSPLVYYNKVNYIGLASDFLSFCARAFDYVTRPNTVLYTRMAHRAYREYLDSNANPFAYLDISVAGGKAERLVFELFEDKCPRTSENFLALCEAKRGGYVGTPFHRVVPGGWVQGGDTAGGHGDGGEAADGGTFADESFEILHDRPGILAMANDGGPHSNGSQFYITLAELPWLDYKRVAFGRVISGFRVVRRLEKERCENQRPVTPCVIVAAGRYTSETYKTSPVGSAKASAGGAEEEKKESPSTARSDLYTQVFNEVDQASRGVVSGRLLAKRIKRAARLFVPFFNSRGTGVLIRAMRAEDTITFEAFTARADEIYKAAHSPGDGLGTFMRLNGIPDSPFGVDVRSEAEQKRQLDLRRPATKKKLLKKIFHDTDTSGDNLVSRAELLDALRKPGSLLSVHFPKHAAEIPSWIDSAGGASLTWEEFRDVATRALSKPGGRAEASRKLEDPRGKDDRPMEEKIKHMDLRRPKTKKKLLRKVFEEVDTSKDGFVDRAELMAALSSKNSPLKKHFPKHLHDVPRWLEGCTKDQKLTFEQFEKVAWEAINVASRGD